MSADTADRDHRPGRGGRLRPWVGVDRRRGSAPGGVGDETLRLRT